MGVGAPGVVVDGPKMRRLRHGRALTLQALARRAGVSYPTVQHMETGGRGCSPTTLDLVAEALAVDPADLLPPEPAHEVSCPACGATIRARMADA